MKGYAKNTSHTPHRTSNTRNSNRAATFFRQSQGTKNLPVFLLKFGLLVGAGFCIWLNIQPYVGVAEMLLEGTVESRALDLLLSLPLIGGLVAKLGDFVITLVGVSIWAIFQILELMPTFLMGTRPMIRRVIDGFESVELLHIDANDLPFVAELKDKHNQMPFEWIRTSLLLATLAYIVDLVVCFSWFPPIKGGIERLGVVLAAPSPSDFDLRNVIFALVTLLAVEAIVWCWMWLGNMSAHFGGQRR
ncbi:MAG: hypothetical protein ACFB5Z_11185 [Elainellaceae cyanobacterium]